MISRVESLCNGLLFQRVTMCLACHPLVDIFSLFLVAVIDAFWGHFLVHASGHDNDSDG